MIKFEDQLTVEYPETATLEVQALYAEFTDKLEALGGTAKIEEIAFIENEGE